MDIDRRPSSPDALSAVFQILELALLRSAQGFQAWKPIVFEVGGSPADLWSFDPRRERLFQRGPIRDPALWVHCTREALVALASEDGDDQGAWRTVRGFGDLGALDVLAASLGSARNVLSIRSSLTAR